MKYNPTRPNNVLVYTFNSGHQFAWYIADDGPIPLLEGGRTYVHIFDVILNRIFARSLIHILEQWPERAQEANAETIQAPVRNQLPSEPIPGWEKIVFGEISEVERDTLLAQLKGDYPDYRPVFIRTDEDNDLGYQQMGAYQGWKRTGGSEQ